MDKFVQIKDSWSKKSQKLGLKGCNVVYYRKAFTIEESKRFFNSLKQLKWAHQDIIVGGKLVKENRLTASYSSDGKITYTYNSTKRAGESFPPVLLEIKKRVEEILDNTCEFNYCLCNYYIDGEHSIGFHSDDEPQLRYPIASISFGAARKFKFRSKTKEPAESIMLEDGSLIVMDEESQKNYLHGIDKEKNAGARINLTFRIIEPETRRFPDYQEGSKRIKVDRDTYIPVEPTIGLEEATNEDPGIKLAKEES